MDLLLSFVIFIASMFLVLIRGWSMIIALLTGLICFLACGLRRGSTFGKLAAAGWKSLRSSFIVILVMLLIGVLTGVWRVSGTITAFVYYGIRIIRPPLFLITAFLLTCLMSYAIGTSFGVAGTCGVVFMALARSGGIDPALCAGAIMSGIYFGDRASPVSSSATLVAGITGTDVIGNVRLMMRSAAVPFAAAAVFYAVLSFRAPISDVDQEIMRSFEESFYISPLSLIPAVLIVLLPLLRIRVTLVMLLSIVSAVLTAWMVQGASPAEVLRACVSGYEAGPGKIAAVLNGGGLVSMLEVVGILLISGMYSGIFNETGMLSGIQKKLSDIGERIGHFPVLILSSIIIVCVFCNQTIATLMAGELFALPYERSGATKRELAIDLENSIIVISGWVPWSIACAVPLRLMGTGPEALIYSVYIFLIPIAYVFIKPRMKEWRGRL